MYTNKHRSPLLFVVIFCSIFSIPLYSQTFTGSVTLSTQTQVDAFRATYGDPTIVEGYFRVRSNGHPAITNLDSLASLQFINGTLDIRNNDELICVNGLSNLDSLGSSLFLSRNPQLQHIDGLRNLTSIGYNLEMGHMDSLVNLNGLANLKTISHDLFLSFLPLVSNLDSLHNLEYVGGDLNLTWLSSLASINGMKSLQHIGENLLLADLDVIPNVDACNTLSEIGGSLYMLRCPMLTNVDGLFNLQSVAGLHLCQNPNLSECCGVFNLINTPGAIKGALSIFDNQTDCDSPVQILTCDGDGDGIPTPLDCNDNDSTVYPGAPELCDGVDNDCNGEIPEEEIDIDGDGFYTCEGDCDDADNSIYPDAPEVCDGIDNNCDGNIDENMDCYCEASAGSTHYEWIKRVKFGEIKNTSGDDEGYGDYTDLSTTLIPEEKYKIKLKPGFSGYSYREYWRVWIDWNQDDSFDDEEIVVQARTRGKSNLRRNIYVPEDALVGNTRMRVAMQYGGYAEACGEFPEGEVEDYTVTIIPPSEGLIRPDEGGANVAVADGRDDEEEEEDLEESVSNVILYPNPTMDRLQVQLPDLSEQTTRIEIYNSIGQLVEYRELDYSAGRTLDFDVSGYGEGVYILSVQLGEEDRMLKQFLVVH